jgi:hypothetical protein
MVTRRRHLGCCVTFSRVGRQGGGRCVRVCKR